MNAEACATRLNIGRKFRVTSTMLEPMIPLLAEEFARGEATRRRANENPKGNGRWELGKDDV